MLDWKDSVRVPGAILSIAALFWGFLQAPFLHVHTEELDHSSVSAPIHLHMQVARAASGIAILAETADDDAIETEWSVTQPPQPVTILADIAPTDNPWVTSPVFFSAVVPVPSQRAHDPPDLTQKQPRSPPA
jgi:hypothetical protein